MGKIPKENWKQSFKRRVSGYNRRLPNMKEATERFIEDEEAPAQNQNESVLKKSVNFIMNRGSSD